MLIRLSISEDINITTISADATGSIDVTITLPDKITISSNPITIGSIEAVGIGKNGGGLLLSSDLIGIGDGVAKYVDKNDPARQYFKSPEFEKEKAEWKKNRQGQLR